MTKFCSECGSPAEGFEIEFEELAYVPPELTDVDEEIAAAALRWVTAEWAREQLAAAASATGGKEEAEAG